MSVDLAWFVFSVAEYALLFSRLRSDVHNVHKAELHPCEGEWIQHGIRHRTRNWTRVSSIDIQ